MPKPGITYKGKPIGASGKGGSKKKSSESTGSSKWLWIFAVVLVIAVIAFAVYRFTRSHTVLIPTTQEVSETVRRLAGRQDAEESPAPASNLRSEERR